ncbi:DUF1772 domain-containing protein [Roseibium sp.]|uniref:anthrone oxygenase family protein n=1 Tax=Roseibium sp. TaxID=1936156 RepID=UPI003D0DB3C0
MMSLLTWLMILASGLMAGLYFAFSSFIMRALVSVDAGGGARAMIAINQVILKSPFLPVFFASTLLAAGLTVYAFTRLPDTASMTLIAAGVVYLAGMFAVTGLFNVPLNDLLDKAGPADEVVWSTYAARWTMWNHLRAAASFVSLVLYVSALTRLA